MRQTRSVTEAAVSLGIPQPTASRGLSRLRETFADQLFVRTARGMEPTPLAESLTITIEEILRLGRQLETSKLPFDPSTVEREFVVAGADVAHWGLMSPVYRAIADYPGIRLRTTSVPSGELANILENGEIDLAIGAYPALIGNIKQQLLVEEHYACFCHAEHPFAKEPTAERFMEANHVLALEKMFGHDHVEAQLLNVLPAHQIRVMSESHFAALATVGETDLILTAPAVSVLPVARKLGLAIVEPPWGLLEFAVRAYWHSRADDDLGHQWFRSTLRKAIVAEKTDVACLHQAN